MQKNALIITTSLLCVLLYGCSGLQFPGVYKIPVEQGNIITQEMIDQLKPGMSRSQVEYIMGSALINDTFNSNRWDYLYRLKQGDRLSDQKRMSIFFEGDSLKYFTGDFVPSTSKTDTNDTGVTN